MFLERYRTHKTLCQVFFLLFNLKPHLIEKKCSLKVLLLKNLYLSYYKLFTCNKMVTRLILFTRAIFEENVSPTKRILSR